MKIQVLSIVLFAIPSLVEATCITKHEAIKRVCARDISKDYLCSLNDEGEPTFRIHKDSCIMNDGEEQLIRDIFSSKKISRRLLNKYSTEQLSRALVYRFHKTHESDESHYRGWEYPDYDMYKNINIMMAFPSKFIDSIIKNGFLNQHQTRTSNGSLSTYNRMRTEGSTMGFNNRSRKMKELLPKYAYADIIQMDRSRELVGLYFNHQYGGAFAVFNDNVKSRSLVSNGDSYDHFMGFSARFGGDREKFQTHSFYWTPEEFYFPLAVLDRQSRQSIDYYEAQLWGPISINDVKYFMIGCPGSNEDIPKFLASISRTQLKIPVYSCRLIEIDNRVARLIPDKLLYGPPLKDDEYTRLRQGGDPVNSILSVNAFVEYTNHNVRIEGFSSSCFLTQKCSFNVTDKLVSNLRERNIFDSIKLEYTCEEDKADAPPRFLKIHRSELPKMVELSCP